MRGLSLEDQLADCADQLGHPDVLAADLRCSLAMLQTWRRTLESVNPPAARQVPLGSPADAAGEALLYPSREIAVLGERCSFTCLATGLDPLGVDGDDACTHEIDFAAVTCDQSRTPVLGALQSERDASAYPLLLRGLATLVELAHPDCLRALDQSVFRGVLSNPPRFDLDLLLFDEPAWGARHALEALTRDLAEKALGSLGAMGDCAGLVQSVVCLRANPKRIDFRLDFGWRVRS